MRKLLSLAVIGLMFLSSSVAAADRDNSNSAPIVVAKADVLDTLVEVVTNPIIKVSHKDLDCLAKNIYYESGSESREGKIAVGMVTINRALHPSFPNTICGVVKQRTTTSIPKEVTETYKVRVRSGFFNKLEERTEIKTVWVQKVVCQFSWNCLKVRNPKADDPRWIESKRVAEDLLSGDYAEHKERFGTLKYFHATYVRPGWKNLKRVARIGGHIFYE